MRASFSLIGVALLSVAAILLSGCGGDRTATGCTPGTNRACTCGSLPGSQSCESTGTYGMCWCDGMPDGGMLDAPTDAPTNLDMDGTDMPSVDMGNVDGATTRAEVLATIPTLPIASVYAGGGTALPNYSCRGSWDQQPHGGGTVSGNFNFDYGGPLNVAIDIKIFPDNIVPADIVCTGTCFTRPTDASGSTAFFDLEAGRFNAWATPLWTAEWGDQMVPMMAYFQWTDQFASYNIREIAPSTTQMGEFYADHSLFWDNTQTTLTGQVLDCDSKLVQGAVVRVFEGGALRYEGDPPVMTYEQIWSDPPDAAVWTHNDGFYTGYDARPSDTHGSILRVEAWANLGSGQPELVSCESVRLFRGVLTNLPLRARRTSSPADCTP